MRGPLAASLALVAVAMIAGAYGLGLFDAGGARPAPPAGQPADEAPAAPAAPPAAGAPSRSPDTPADVPEIRTPLPVATTATLRIDSDVPGADVFIDNSFVGKAPAVVEGVTPGRRKISVSAPGYETVAEFRDVAPGPGELTLALRTIRLNRRVAVTHRHRLGSCEGTLAATPEGIRYETSNTEDAFNAPLTRVGTFEADYLKRNVKVGIPGGRTWNFTVPDGRADALYSFYQDVEKVRQRLLDEGAGDV